VTYTQLHILTSVISLYCDMSYIFFIALFMVLFISYLLFTVYHVIIVYTLFIYTSTFPFSYTLIGLLSDDPEFACPVGCFLLLIRCSLILYASWEAGVSLPILVFWASFLFLLFLQFPWFYIITNHYFIPHSCVMMCEHLYVYCSDHDLL